jgi:hypothetical protein
MAMFVRTGIFIISIEQFYAYHIEHLNRMPIIPAPSARRWMMMTSNQFAKRCLPLLMANQSGWLILSPVEASMVWNGGPYAKNVRVECEQEMSRDQAAVYLQRIAHR